MQRQHGMITAAGLASTYRFVSVTATQLLGPTCAPIFLRSPGNLCTFYSNDTALYCSVKDAIWA